MRNAYKTQTTKEMKPQMSGNFLFLWEAQTIVTHFVMLHALKT
jgi:hypothetical protein